MSKIQKPLVNRGGKIHIHTSVNGNRLRFSTFLPFNAENIEFVSTNLEAFIDNHLNPNISNANNDFLYYGNKFLQTQKPFIKKNTFLQYQSTLKGIVKIIGNRPIKAYYKDHIELFYTKLLQKNLCSATISLYCMVLNAVFTLAEQSRSDFRNPFFQKKLRNIKPSKERMVFSLEEVFAILKESKRPMYPASLHLYLTLAFFSGARCGEIFALESGDFDLENKTLKITKTLSANGIQSPKTKTSNRVIDVLPPILNLELKTQGRLFKGKYAKLIHNFRQSFNRVLKALNLPNADLYCTRHTFASIMLQKGEEPMWISQMLGHSNLNITYKVYAKFIKNSNKERATFLNDYKE